MKVRIVTALLLLGAALGVLTTGSRAGDKDTATRKGKLYKTPEAVFKALSAAVSGARPFTEFLSGYRGEHLEHRGIRRFRSVVVGIPWIDVGSSFSELLGQD